MSESGYETLPNLDEQFKIDDDILDALKEDTEVWTNFENFPDLYKRIKIGNIQKYRKSSEDFDRMLANFIKKTKENKIIGNWNDYGRL